MSGKFFLVLVMSSSFLSQSGYAEQFSRVERGKYLFITSDCIGCHGNRSDESPSGGRALETPFGVFYAPNISSNPDFGIGKWSNADFIKAMRHGVRPDGEHLFPVFPYPSYSGLTDEDMSAIKEYLWTLPPSAAPNRSHEIKFPFRYRSLMAVWKLLFFKSGPLVDLPEKSPQWNRGRYLVQAVAHCTECHTPRNSLTGVLDHHQELSGNINGPDGMNAPNITPDSETGIGQWTEKEIMQLLKTGETPDFDLVSSGMTSVIRGTKILTDEDRQAIAVYLKDLKPIRSKAIKK